MNDPTMIFLLYAVGFVVAIFVTRAIFSIGAIVSNLKAQTTLLICLAKKEGISRDIINSVIVRADLNDELKKRLKEQPVSDTLPKENVT